MRGRIRIPPRRLAQAQQLVQAGAIVDEHPRVPRAHEVPPGDGHEVDLQALKPLHVTSHLHELAQLTSLQLFWPHSTLQAAEPHVIERQLWLPEQVIAQPVLSLQSTPLHELLPAQLIVQL